jgi:predicted phage terminase large subunit-like protein
MERRVVEPHAGPQTDYFLSPADVLLYGGGAGGGKSFSLLIDPLRDIHRPGFRALLLRRTRPMLTMPGGLWDESFLHYPLLGGKANLTDLYWRFPSGSVIQFAGMEHEGTKLKYQGAQLGYIGFDELTHFTETQFSYMLSRARTTSGMRPRVRAGCNPDANSWVKRVWSPWLDRNSPIQAKPGELLYMTGQFGQIEWSREPRQIEVKGLGIEGKQLAATARSFSFIPASLADNPTLVENDPGYAAMLQTLDRVERARLLLGDWDITEAGNMFDPDWFRIVDEPPAPIVAAVRYWDLAASKPKPGTDPDYSAGVLMAKMENGQFIILHVARVRETPATVEGLVLKCANGDQRLLGGGSYQVRMEEERGGSGKIVIDRYRRLLPLFDFRGVSVSGEKAERAKPLSAASENGDIMLLRGAWNRDFLAELGPFPDPRVHDDQVDAASGAYTELAGRRGWIHRLNELTL